MNLSEAKELFNETIKTREIKLHCFEVAVIMKFLARELKEDEEKWEIVGLLHDLDYETEKELDRHAKKTAEMLKDKADDEIIKAILSHNEKHTGVKRTSKLDFCLSAADNIAGLIYAYGLVRKSLEGMEAKGLRKRMKEKAFAAAIRRDEIYDVERVMPLDRFLEVSIEAMKSIASEIGF